MWPQNLRTLEPVGSRISVLLSLQPKKKVGVGWSRLLSGVTQPVSDQLETRVQSPNSWSYFLPFFLELPFLAIK